MDVSAEGWRPEDIPVDLWRKIHCFAKSEDQTQRRPQFVTDIGGKLLFETTGIIGVLACPDQLKLDMLLGFVSAFQRFERLGEFGTVIACYFQKLLSMHLHGTVPV